MHPKVRDELIVLRGEISDQILATMAKAKVDKVSSGPLVALEWVERVLQQQDAIYHQCESRDQMLHAVGAETALQNFYARWKNGIPQVHVDYLSLTR